MDLGNQFTAQQKFIVIAIALILFFAVDKDVRFIVGVISIFILVFFSTPVGKWLIYLILPSKKPEETLEYKPTIQQ